MTLSRQDAPEERKRVLVSLWGNRASPGTSQSPRTISHLLHPYPSRPWAFRMPYSPPSPLFTPPASHSTTTTTTTLAASQLLHYQAHSSPSVIYHQKGQAPIFLQDMLNPDVTQRKASLHFDEEQDRQEEVNDEPVQYSQRKSHHSLLLPLPCLGFSPILISPVFAYFPVSYGATTLSRRARRPNTGELLIDITHDRLTTNHHFRRYASQVCLRGCLWAR